MPHPPHCYALPLPRLVLRLGGLGNRKVGENNGIAENPDQLWNHARLACDVVLNALEAALLHIHQDLPPKGAPHPESTTLPWWKTHLLGSFFGQADRWGSQQPTQTSIPVFAPDRPLISLLSGDAEGADILIRERAEARRMKPAHPVDYELLRVTPEAPQNVPDGLGVGLPAAKDPQLQTKVDAKQNLTRGDAHAQSRIARRRAYAFRAQSEALRHHCDVLLAIWDPDAEGKAGGTSESVEEALRAQIPVIAVRLTGQDTAEIHMLTHLRHLRYLQGQGGVAPQSSWEAALQEVLEYLLAFPDPQRTQSKSSHTAETTAYQPRFAFAAFREGLPLQGLWPGKVWRKFDTQNALRAIENLREEKTQANRMDTRPIKLASGHPGQDASENAPVESANPPPAPTSASNSATSAVGPNQWIAVYNHAQKRAGSKGFSGVYGDAHRGGILLSYLLAAVAVLLAVVGGLMHVWHAPAWCQIVVALVEVVAIFTMWALQVSSGIDEWNAAYTDTRILAEALRFMEFLAPLGVHTPLPRLPYYLQKSEDAANPDRLWSIWYFRALVRMAPLRVADGDLGAARERIQNELHAKQQRYHQKNARKNLLLHHSIERSVPALFGFVGLVAAIHLFDVMTGAHVPGIFGLSLIVCVGGPALISALHGFASRMECQRLHLRSSSMERLLHERSEALASLDLSDPNSAEAVWGLASEALATASMLMDETAGWSMLYRNADIHAG